MEKVSSFSIGTNSCTYQGSDPPSLYRKTNKHNKLLRLLGMKMTKVVGI